MASVPDVLAATGGPAGARQARTVRPVMSAALALAVLGAATWVLVQQVDAVQVQRTLAGLRPSLVVGVVALEVLAFVSLAQVYRTTHRLAGGAIPWREAASITTVLVALGVANLVAALPLTPGGIGLVEAGMAGVLVAFGVDPVPASLTAISYRVVAQWLPVVVALPVLARGALRRPWQEEVP